MTTSETTERNLDQLCAEASRIRDQKKGRTVSFSPKVFIPLTRLCRDFCGYCTFRQSPQQVDRLFMSPDEVLAVARAGEAAGCREALFVLGERPEERYPEAQQWLHDRGCDSTLEYLRQMCALVLGETALYPHSNPGNMERSELQALKEVNASMGLMVESTSARLCQPGGPHERAPSKRPELRLETLRMAGELQIPFTTGLLIGIGETAKERVEALLAIRDLQDRYGHIQEVIIQNFRAKPDTPMKQAAEPSMAEILETAATARIILGQEMNIQAPPNLAPNDGGATYLAYLKAGINDWGGISPVTVDYVNPEAPWPHIGRMQREMEAEGFQLRARFPVYPEYIWKKSRYLPDGMLQRLRSQADSQGYIRSDIAAPLWSN